MRQHIFRHGLSCFAVVAALVGIAGGAHAQSTSQTSAQDTTRMTDSTHKAKHHKHHKMTSTGDVADPAKNQSQSGVVDSSGKSTLGSKIKKATPTSGQPVMAKGDTLRHGDSPVPAPTDSTKPKSP